MPGLNTTVFYATNRLLTGPDDDVASYGNDLAAAGDAGITYGVGFVGGTVIPDTVGQIVQLNEVGQAAFAAQAASDIANAGRNLLVFLHGYANSFADAILRAALNREWIAAGGQAADSTVLAFSWPSLGEIWPDPCTTYRSDQAMSGRCGPHLNAFFSAIAPVLAEARRHGRRTTLLAHSMGNRVLEMGLASWFAAGKPAGLLFDEVVLAAADVPASSLAGPPTESLGGLPNLAGRISVYHSDVDQVLHLSAFINGGAPRLGQTGPVPMPDGFAALRLVDCGADFYHDFPGWDDLMQSHQYYRLSPHVRQDIATVMAGNDPATAAAAEPALG